MNIEKFLNKLQEGKDPEEGFHVNMEEATISNKNFRKVLFTTSKLQLVVMSLKPNEDIGLEVHKDTSQFIRVDKGSGKAIIGKDTFSLKNGDAIIIPQGIKHNVIAGDSGIKLYTVYAPPHHPEDAVHATKQDAIKAEGDKEAVK